MASVLTRFDPKNKQEDFQFMAKEKDTDRFVIGYIYISKPWFSRSNMWGYFIMSNRYGNTGLSVGMEDLGMEKIQIVPSTIMEYNQIAGIIYNQSIGFDTKLVDDDDKTICIISPTDPIPYHFWSVVSK